MISSPDQAIHIQRLVACGNFMEYAYPPDHYSSFLSSVKEKENKNMSSKVPPGHSGDEFKRG
jgi:hypothetical protein